jgi:simple sugar transport system substrate-binding protein
VKDFEKVFTEANGYEVSTFYSLKNDEQLNAASQFITEGVDYILLSAAATDGWASVLANAKEAGIKVFLFDRMLTRTRTCMKLLLFLTWQTRVTWLLNG